MSRSINRVELLGHLGQNAEVKFTQNGTQVASFSIATSRRWKPKDSNEWKEETDWHKCVLWRCENLAQFLTKGKQLLVIGRMQTRKYEDRDGVTRYLTEVIVEDLILLGGGAERSSSAQSSGPAPTYDGQGISDDDVPF